MNKKLIVALCVIAVILVGIGIYMVTLTPEEYSVSFSSVNGEVSIVKIEDGNVVSKPQDPVKDGYTFVGWELNGKPYDFSTPVTENITLVAKFEKEQEEIKEDLKEYTVQFNSDGGSTVVSQKVKEGYKVEKPTNPEKQGYVFVNWTLDGKEYDFNTKVSKDMELKATWKKTETVKVTFNTDGGSSVSSQTIEKGKTVSKPANPTKTGYKFKEWTLNGKTYDFKSAVNTNITLKATWTKVETVTVTFSTDGGSSVSSQTIEKGKTASKPSNPTKDDYRFKAWTLDGKTYDFKTAVSKNITLVATWEKIEYVTVTFNTDGGNSVTAQTIEKGKVASKPSNPTKTGYIFKGWTLNGASYDFGKAVTSNITITATWEKIEYVTVTFDTDGGNSVATQKIEKGMKASKPNNPTRDGYRFKGWTLNGTNYDFSKAVTSNITITATWEKIEYVTVTFDTDGGNSVASQTIEKGKTASKPSDPTKDGYRFAGWTLNGSIYNFGTAVNSNITITANWNQKTYTAKVTNVDGYSTDRYITIYEEGTPITVSGIYYASGTRIPTAAVGNKLSVAAAEISGVTTIKVKLASGSMVTATMQ